jgi:sialic acid synthase SpsE
MFLERSRETLVKSKVQMFSYLANKLLVSLDVDASSKVASFELVQEDVLVGQQGDPVLLTAGWVSPGSQHPTYAGHRWRGQTVLQDAAHRRQLDSK